MTSVTVPHQLLKPEFLDALEELAKDPAGSWWQDILLNPDVFIAVRRNYLNAYYHGASIFRIEWSKNKVIPKIHAKYLVKPVQAYVTLEEGKFDIEAKDVLQDTYKGMSTLRDLCRAALPYAGVEKSGLHPMMVGNADVIDSEIALTPQSPAGGVSDDEAGSINDKQIRIDAAVAILVDGNPTIRFYEAKHFTNAELRASGTKDAAVIEQISHYEAELKKQQDQLSARYLETARALMRFDRMRMQAPGGEARHSPSLAIRQIAETGQLPLIDPSPHLIYYGFDKAQLTDSGWAGQHLKKLKEKLGKERIMGIGKPLRSTKFVK